MINVTSKIKVIEIDAKAPQEVMEVKVSSHRNNDTMVVLQLPHLLHSYAVFSRDLESALANASNTAREVERCQECGKRLAAGEYELCCRCDDIALARLPLSAKLDKISG